MGLKMERDLEEKVRENPSTRLFAPLADYYRKKGLIDKAVETLIRGLTYHPNYISARVLLARCYEDLGEWKKAMEEWQRVLNLDSCNLVALKGMGEICRMFGEYGESCKWFRTYLDEFPGDDTIRERLEEIERDLPIHSGGDEEKGENDRAVMVQGHRFGRSLELDAGDEEVGVSPVETEGDLEENYGEVDSVETITLAEIYAQQGFYERAIGIFRSILAQDPDNRQVMERINALNEKLSQGTVTDPSAEEESKEGSSSTEDSRSRPEGSKADEDSPPEGVDEAIEPININSATSLELEAIPGVGPVIAQKIVLERERNGPFMCREDLKRVPSLGERIIERVIPHLKFETVLVEGPGDRPEMVGKEGKKDVGTGILEEDYLKDGQPDEPIGEEEDFDLEFEEFRKWLKNLRK